ncbi:hypothetical protein OSTOST_06457 [Ostertagia ostertagi]
MTEAQRFGKPFQTLVFCVRDFRNPEEYGYGEEGGTKFLQQVLKVTPDQPEELRSVREQLSDCFEHISCFLLPYPGYRVAERQSFRGHVKDLRPIFREEMKKMIPALLNPHALQPKYINGKPVTCRKLVQYFKEYVNSFDGNTVPVANSILNANAKLICIEAAHEAKGCLLSRNGSSFTVCGSTLKAKAQSMTGSRMLPEKRLLEAHIKHGITALNIYDKCPKFGSAETRNRLLEKLQEDINAELERYKRLNAAKKVTGCASAMTACGDSALLGVGLGAAAYWNCCRHCFNAANRTCQRRYCCDSDISCHTAHYLDIRVLKASYRPLHGQGTSIAHRSFALRLCLSSSLSRL